MQTTAIVKAKAFEAIRLVIPAGREIPAHEVAGDIMLHCLEGRVALDLPDAGLELAAGDWVYLEGGARHRVKAVEDASLLLTILFSP
ncbi:MAG TPA: cupin domain-containing protein [Sphingobium sp.]|nr:cupin domain-containing protein [Sphingobium sp.]